VTNLISLFGIFMMRQFSGTIPNETIESARIDGAGELRIFHAICLPMWIRKNIPLPWDLAL
jgi:ABC-type glycerol-3-phosphate transport system permease component